MSCKQSVYSILFVAAALFAFWDSAIDSGNLDRANEPAVDPRDLSRHVAGAFADQERSYAGEFRRIAITAGGNGLHRLLLHGCGVGFFANSSGLIKFRHARRRDPPGDDGIDCDSGSRPPPTEF